MGKQSESTKIDIICLICQKVFRAWSWEHRVVCSRQCGGIYRRNPDPFWPNTVRVDGHLDWIGRRDDREGFLGYGRLCANGVMWSAHRYAWFLAHGPIPEGMVVCHSCDRPQCCEVTHLFLATQQENMNDKWAKGRGSSGDRNGSRKFPERLRRGYVRPPKLLPKRIIVKPISKCACGCGGDTGPGKKWIRYHSHPEKEERACPQCGTIFEVAHHQKRIYCTLTCYHEHTRMEDPVWSRTEITPTCHLFTGPLSESGYGEVAIKGKKVRVHRYVWELANGPIPEGLFVCHRCDVRNCIRLNHLFLGTHEENMADAVAKGRMVSGDRSFHHQHPELLRRGDAHHSRLHPEVVARGIRSGMAKLNDDAIRQIKKLLEEGVLTQKQIADRFGVCKTTIGNIKAERIWRHVK